MIEFKTLIQNIEVVLWKIFTKKYGELCVFSELSVVKSDNNIIFSKCKT